MFGCMKEGGDPNEDLGDEGTGSADSGDGDGDGTGPEEAGDDVVEDGGTGIDGSDTGGGDTGSGECEYVADPINPSSKLNVSPGA